jgi:hypothetical protein
MSYRGTRAVVLATVVATCLSGTVSGPAGAAAPPQQAGKGRTVQEVRSLYTSELGVRRPRDLRWDAKRDAFVVTGTRRDGSLRAVSMAPDGSRLGTAPVRALDKSRPRATHPRTKLRYVAKSGGTTLAAVDTSGAVVRSLDISALDVKDLEAMTFAPSSDTTDASTEQSLFIADAGDATELGRVIEVDLNPVVAAAPTSSATLVATRDTSTWSPPSPDPSGVAFAPGADRLIVSDGEVDEMPIYAGANLYNTSRTGTLSGTGTTLPWSNEPTGVAYNTTNGHLLTTDDDKKQVFELASPGGDGRYGTADDGARTTFKTSTFGNTDPEDLAVDTLRRELLLVDGVGREVFRLNPGPNGTFNGVPPGGDDIATQFDIEMYGAVDPEGIAYDTVRDTILVVDGSSDAIYELDSNGSLLNTISISPANAVKAAGITIAPASDGSGGRHYYVVDRGLDNNSHPGENDGKLYELSASLAAITNRPPAANAGPDQMIDLPQTATLAGSAVDDGKPTGSLSYSWTKQSGPGVVTFGSAKSANTTATFSMVGTYVLRLTVSDSQLDDFDDVVVTVFEPGAPRTVTLPIASGSDDAMEGGGTSGKFVDLASADIELGHNGGTAQAPMLDGLRFTGLPVPKGGEILSAKIQFKVDETGSETASYKIRGEAADNASTYLSVAGNISSRPSTTATVPWAPPAWTTIGQAGPAQLTPDLKTIVQEVVNRPGWVEGNAVAFMIDGTGRRTAEAKDGLSPAVLVLQFRRQAPNAKPVVSAGPDLTVTLAAGATLDGTVTDDSQVQATPTTAWSKVSGPGTVTFGNPAQVDTTATFSQAGSYTLRLTAHDGALSASDDVVVEVQPAPNANPVVSAGTDQHIRMPAAASLDGTLVSPGSPGAITYAWTEASGPGTVSFAAPHELDTTATFSQAGTYLLQLTASNGVLEASDQVQVTVDEPATVVAPHVSGALTESTVAVRERTRFTGIVSPAADGHPVQLQRLDGDRWVTVATTQLPAGSSSAYSFDIRRKASGHSRYRTFVPSYAGMASTAFEGPANGLALRVYRAEITAVRHAGDEFVTVANTGAVRIDLRGWLLVNRRTGAQRTLPTFAVRPGHIVRIHSGAGNSDRNDLYLKRRDMWGRHATAVLRNERSVLLDRLGY